MKIKHSIKTGICFGLTSGTITTLGLMVGLNSGTHSKLIVIAGILTIAVADAFSDALGIHISEEAENKHNAKEIWQSTISTFTAKFIFALTFIIPVLLFDLNLAVIISIFWGFIALSILSYLIAKEQKKNTGSVVAEHVIIAIIVILLTHYIGQLISTYIG